GASASHPAGFAACAGSKRCGAQRGCCMIPQVAFILFALGIVGLFYLDRERGARTSPALWIAVVWAFVGASRMFSEWLGTATPVASPGQYVEGSPIDRAILSGLLAVGIVVLITRQRKSAELLRGNKLILVFFVYCALSALWSDFPFVALKRWTKALGNIVMVFVVLTDPNQPVAIKRFLARTGFLLIPVSVLLIKYFPDMGRAYNRWSWQAYYTGASTDKNGLGAICVIFGLASLWRFVEALRENAMPGRRRILMAHGAILAMSMWLFQKADSSTSMACFGLGGVLILVALRSAGKSPRAIHATIGALAGVA